jgi:hypothetical protein
MPVAFTVINDEFRDMTAAAAYPFYENSPRGNDLFRFQDDFILDALIYGLGVFKAPYHVSSIEGGYASGRGINITISDINQRMVCSGVIDMDEDAAFLKGANGLQSGVLVYSSAGAADAVGNLNNRKVAFSPADTQMQAGVCLAVSSFRFAGFSEGGRYYSGDIKIIGRNGVVFEEDGDALRIDMYGEEHLYPKTVKSINNVTRDHYWVAAHPDSSVRVITSGTDIKFATKQSFSLAATRKAADDSNVDSGPKPGDIKLDPDLYYSLLR